MFFAPTLCVIVYVAVCKYVGCVGERRGERKEDNEEGREKERRGYEEECVEK